MMFKIKLSIFVLIILCINITSCQKSTSTIKKYNFFFTPYDHIDVLLKDNDYKSAYQIYCSQSEYFEEKHELSNNIELEIANQVNEYFIHKFQKSENALRSIEWPSCFSEWNFVKNTLDKAEMLLAEYESFNILFEKELYIDSYIETQKSLLNLKEKITISSYKVFASYPHSVFPLFFEKYPVIIDVREFFQKYPNLVFEVAETLNSTEIQYFFALYKEYLDEPSQERLSQQYFHARIKEIASSSEMSFSVFTRIVKETLKNGMLLGKSFCSNILILDMTDYDTFENILSSFDINIDNDLSLNFKKSDIEEIPLYLDSEEYDVVILLDFTKLENYREIISYESVNSEFIAGHRSVPNPQYSYLTRQINIANNDLQNVIYEGYQIQSQQCQGILCIAKNSLLVANALLERKLREKVSELSNTLRFTQMHIDEPVYQNYTFNKTTIESLKNIKANYYIFDSYANKSFSGVFEYTKSMPFVVAYNISEKDKNFSRHKNKLNSEQEITDFESGTISIELSDIISSYIKNDTYQTEIKSKEEIQSLVKSDRLVAKNEASTSEYIVTSKDDERFESVVVLAHPGGSFGSGFYVTPEIVLTNYHVIDGTQFVEMMLYDGSQTFGKVYAQDIRLDIALVKVQKRGLPVQFYKEKNLKLGDTVEAIGHPLGLNFSITRGVISGMRDIESRYMAGGNKVKFIQTDVAINPGNSGGPLFLKDKVIGINTQKVANIEAEGLGFAIHYSEIINFLEKNGVVSK